MEDDNLTICLWLRPLLEKVTGSTEFGSSFPAISQLSSSGPRSLLFTVGSEIGDQFTLTLPYAEETINCRLSFCWCHAEIPPEIDFLEDADFEPPLDELSEWDANNVDCLNEWLMKIMEYYKSFHCDLCRTHSRMNAEIERLSNPDPDQSFSSATTLDTVEIKIYTTGPRRGDALFVTSVQIPGVASLPISPDAKLMENADNTQFMDDEVIIKALYRKLGDNGVDVEVLLSPFINQLLSKSRFVVPKLEGFFSEYVQEINRRIAEEVDYVVHSIDRRQRFVSAMLIHFDKRAIDFDSALFMKASFLLEYKDFSFVLIVTLPELFPSDRCNIALSSVYHEKNHGEPYRYNIDWRFSGQPKSMIDQLVRFLDEHVPKFQKETCTKGI